MINRKIALLLAAATLTLAPATAHAGIFDFLKRKKKPKTEKAPEKSAYEKILTDKPIVSAKGDFLTLHKTDNKLYVELPVKTIGKEILVARHPLLHLQSSARDGRLQELQPRAYALRSA